MSAKPVSPSAFESGPSNSATVEDVYDGGGIAGLNIDSGAASSTGSFGLPAGKISETLSDPNIATIQRKEGKGLADIVKDTTKKLPPNASLGDVLLSNSLSDIYVNADRIGSSVSPAALSNMDSADFSFLLGETGKMTDSVLAKDGSLSLEDLVDNGTGVDYAVTAAVGVFAINQAMGRKSPGIIGLIGKTALPDIFKDAAMESILDLAADYGLEGVVSSLFDIIEEKLSPAKKKETVERLLRKFRWATEPVITELSTAERSLIESGADFLGLDKTTTNVVAEVIEGAVYEESYPNKGEQAKTLVNTLNKIDKNWYKAKRNGETIYLLDKFRFASRDAREALAIDDRTREPYAVQLAHNARPHSWRRGIRKYYPHIYV